MLRFLTTAALGALLTAAFLVFNPSDYARDLLAKLDLLETLRDSYAIEPPPPPPPQPQPAAAPQPVNPFADAYSPPDAQNRNQQEDFLARSVRLLQEENRELTEKMKLHGARRGSSSIPSGDARALQRQIDANNARILDLKDQQKKL